MNEKTTAQLLMDLSGQPVVAVQNDMNERTLSKSISAKKNKNKKTTKNSNELKIWEQHEDLEARLEQRAVVLKATNWELRQEISRRAEVEQAVREERNRYRTLVETIPYGIMEFDIDGIITFANAESHRIFEYPDGELTKKCLWDILWPILPDVQSRLEDAIHEQTAPVPHFHAFHNSTGKNVEIKVDWNYKRNACGKITGIVSIITDITQQRRVEIEAQQRLNQLAHVTRILTMNQMVSGLAHELNQPLTAIVNFAQASRHRLLESTVKCKQMLLDSIEQISLQADRAGQIIRRMRDFVRRADSSRSRETINELVGDVLGLMQSDARTHNVQIKTILATDLPRVLVDRIQIEQVITNLLKNAMEATANQTPELRLVTLRTEINSENMLEVSVTDNGKGLSHDQLIHIFEPFYTTKLYGMGLGLSISRSIVDAHGGRLDAVKNNQWGMTFRFTLPIAKKEGKV